MVCQAHQVFHARFRRVGIIRVHADGGIYVRVLFGQGQDLRKIRQVDRHAQRVGDLIVGHGGQHFRQFFSQFRKIDV